MAHRAYLRDGAVARAVRCAFWLGLALVVRGEHARGGGWPQRAQRVLAEAGLDCVERGYLQLPAGLRALHSDPAAAHATIYEVTAVADRRSCSGAVGLAASRAGAQVVATDIASRVGTK